MGSVISSTIQKYMPTKSSQYKSHENKLWVEVFPVNIEGMAKYDKVRKDAENSIIFNYPTL